MEGYNLIYKNDFRENRGIYSNVVYFERGNFGKCKCNWEFGRGESIVREVW